MNLLVQLIYDVYPYVSYINIYMVSGLQLQLGLYCLAVLCKLTPPSLLLCTTSLPVLREGSSHSVDPWTREGLHDSQYRAWRMHWVTLTNWFEWQTSIFGNSFFMEFWNESCAPLVGAPFTPGLHQQPSLRKMVSFSSLDCTHNLWSPKGAETPCHLSVAQAWAFRQV
jgi:hypothetical protein